ncbi:hypothetical protein WMY93_032912 [Mugilogobius chulae]|uniref:SAM domain-containing protein n=1 Tax=Mugilogobius chulae TaxID=88201 RepID=A0AAW0MLT3_9GOBI
MQKEPLSICLARETTKQSALSCLDQMSGFKTERPIRMDHWTKDHVREWLISDVKVSRTYAQRFFDEDVTGECLVEFTKSEILDLDIKHGPAVKILFYLKQWKQQTKPEPQYPEFVLSWSKEQVNMWFLQHLKLYEKYAQRLLDEDVSGDCLVCFEKQDFKDLEIKHGPIVKILAELGRLKDKPEPELLPVTTVFTEEVTKQQSVQSQQEQKPVPHTEQRPAPPPEQRPEPHTEKRQEPHTEQRPAPPPKLQPVPQPTTSSQVSVTHGIPLQKSSAPNMKTAEVSGTGILIYEMLNNLGEEDMKQFRYRLRNYTSSGHRPIPHSKLENADYTKIASLLCSNYVDEAPCVTMEILRAMHKNQSALELEAAVDALKSKELHPKRLLKAEADQGDKLKNLLTCGGNTLDNYDRFVIVLNKSRSNQVQHLHFLSKLKLFCVLDFDPNSVCPGGVCHSYREFRVANLHSPAQYEGRSEVIIKNLNLYKQTSWVFCNGRNDLDDHQELDYKIWLKTSCRAVEQLVSFICKPEVNYDGTFLVIFILLSPVETEKDPMFDTYRCFFKNTSEQNIVTLCESKSTYSKWKELVQEKCDTDIDPFSINELSLGQINGTIMALGPQNQSTGKLLPSGDSTRIVLKQKEEDLMTALEILGVNQCENIHDENSEQFKQFKLKKEEDFYRGGKVTWWNFYFCDKDKDKPFIKRDKYENVKQLIRTQLKDPKNSSVLTLFHDPGCGATTLAMHVMWNLRKELRCAVLKDNKVSKEEVAHQTIKLMKLDNEKPCSVLLLMDDSKEMDTTNELVYFIQKTISNMNTDFTSLCKVIIVNCVRRHSPKEQYREHSTSPCQYLTASLTAEEQQDFEKKLKELEETHNRPENFYSFMLMKSNFDPKYTQDLASNTLEKFKMSTKECILFAFLALLNTYVADSEISLSLCEDFLGIKSIPWKGDSVLNRMVPYSNLLKIEKVKGWRGYKGVRCLHNQIAAACLEELEKQHELEISDVTMEILHYDLFYSEEVDINTRLMKFVKQMLIKRRRKEDGEREQFSPLVEKIHNDMGRQTVEEIFVKASTRFEASASIPQALARYLYIKERDFPEALKWAQKAKNIIENPYIFDTIAQVYKSNLKHNMEHEKQEKLYTPEGLDTNLQIAINAIAAFERAQELAPIDIGEEPEDDQDYPRESYTIYGYVGVVEITFLVFEILGRLPFFDENRDTMNKLYLRSFLERNLPITSVHKENTVVNDKYVTVIREHERFLLDLKIKVKDTFEILTSFFTYLKPKVSEFDSKNRRTISEHFKKYVTLFCTEPEQVKKECQSNPELALKMEIEQRRLFLEKKNADNFSGILPSMDRSVAEMEEITLAYAYLCEHRHFNSKSQATKETTNFILSNIVLHLLNPKSRHVLSYTKLSDLLQKTLQDVGLRSNFPDPYYTALLLFWPSPIDKTTNIQTYVTAIRHASRKHLSAYFRGRSTVAHLFLAKGSGLSRLVSKSQLDEKFKKITRNTLAELWRNGDIFREKIIKDVLLRVKGIIEDGEVYAKYGSHKVNVHPALISKTRSGFSTEKVSFFLGFAINGPLAYDIQNEN